MIQTHTNRAHPLITCAAPPLKMQSIAPHQEQSSNWYLNTNYTALSHFRGMSASARNFVEILFYTETAFSLALQLLNIYLFYKQKHKTAAELLSIQLICAQTMLNPTNAVLFKHLKEGHTRVMLSLGVSLDLAQVLLLLVITIDRIVAVKLADRYSKVIKRNTAMLVGVLIWGLSIFYGAANIGIASWRAAYLVQVSCDMVLLAVFIGGYSFVMFQVNLLKQRAREMERDTSVYVHYPDIPYSLQMRSVIVYFYFHSLPTVTVLFGLKIFSVHYLFWSFTYLLVASFYLCGLKRSLIAQRESKLLFV